MKNWKTTLIGAIGAVASVVLPLVQSGAVTVKDGVIAGVMALLGFFAKDAGVSGVKK